MKEKEYVEILRNEKQIAELTENRKVMFKEAQMQLSHPQLDMDQNEKTLMEIIGKDTQADEFHKEINFAEEIQTFAGTPPNWWLNQEGVNCDTQLAAKYKRAPITDPTKIYYYTDGSANNKGKALKKLRACHRGSKPG